MMYSTYDPSLSATASIYPAKMPASSPPTPHQTFTLFPNLAPELRLKIWSHACFAQTITLLYSQTTDTFTSTSIPPAALSVNRESRAEALRTYKLSFGTKSHEASIYFNPYEDTLYLPRCREMGYDETLRDFRELVRAEEKECLDEVRSVAIDHVGVDVKRPWESYNKAMFLRGFKKLDEIVLVWRDIMDTFDGKDEIGVYGDVEFVHPKEHPETLVRVWAHFRGQFVTEERLLEDIAKVVGREYESFVLPTVRIREKILKERDN
jgi:hypothetical protein